MQHMLLSLAVAACYYVQRAGVGLHTTCKSKVCFSMQKAKPCAEETESCSVRDKHASTRQQAAI